MSTLQAKKPQRRTPSGFVTRNGTIRPSRSRYEGKKISLEDYFAWERPADGRKYEWNQGIIETNEATMTLPELAFVSNIEKVFDASQYAQRGDKIYLEVEFFLPSIGKTRRPDISYLSAEQMKHLRSGEPIIPAFVVEIVSQHDKINAMKAKIQEYFESGVQVVWYITPIFSMIEVYTSPHDVMICKGDTLCSAAPALPEFSMKASDVFA